MLYATPEGKAALEVECNDACGIRPAWAELVDQAGLVDFNLSETKTAFSITTRQQVMKQSCAMLSCAAAMRVSALSSSVPLNLMSVTGQQPVALLIACWSSEYKSMHVGHARNYAASHAPSLP